jgi:hypothetical protein
MSSGSEWGHLIVDFAREAPTLGARFRGGGWVARQSIKNGLIMVQRCRDQILAKEFTIYLHCSHYCQKHESNVIKSYKQET